MLRRVLHRDVIAQVKANIVRHDCDAIASGKSPERGGGDTHVSLGSALHKIHLRDFLRFITPARFPNTDPSNLMESFQRFLYHHFPSLRQQGIMRPRVHHLPDLSRYTVSGPPLQTA
jgi:hypothetical protein